MKKTKMICSIGPSTHSWENFKGIVEAGMNVARINFSHATIEERLLTEKLVKRANKELGANIAVLYDTKGPDLRTCSFVDDCIELIKGNTIRIMENDDKEALGTAEEIYLNHKGVLKDLHVGSKILLDDGFYQLVVKEILDNGVTCEIINSGIIKSRRGVCIPGIKLDIPYISPKDEEDIKYACDHDGDFLAISFVNSADDIKQVKELCAKFGKPKMTIISKVETQYAIENIEEIVIASDYVMVARGDLGIEAGIVNLPIYQKIIIDMCHKHGKGIIMATQMMHSMKTNIRPTNAEVNDVANAVLAGCDAIMTSDETTIGNYPVETVKTMAEICENVEKITDYNLDDFHLSEADTHDTITKCVVKASAILPMKAIVASTLTGKTAIDISSLRPNAFIIATVINEKIARKLALKWGVYTKLVPIFNNTDDIVHDGIQAAQEILNLKTGDTLAVVGGYPFEAHTNFLKIHEI